MSRTRRALAGVMAVLAAATLVAGCGRTVQGTAQKEGTSDVPRNDDSMKKYPNLLKECEVLTEDILAKTVGADPLDIQSTFVGAICRWQAANPAGLIDITRFWFEQGSLENERQVATKLNYQLESKRINGVDSIIMHTTDANGACGVASDAAGVVGWWVNPQAPGIDACGMATKLMELTLNTSS
jgi:predicted small secreted protein